MAAFKATPDEITTELAPYLACRAAVADGDGDGDGDVVADGDVVIDRDVVVFRGWLSKKSSGIYRLFTSQRLNEWLEIPEAALLFQLPGKERLDSKSVVWVKHQARLVKSHEAKACHFAEEPIELDPTTGDGAEYPRYGHH